MHQLTVVADFVTSPEQKCAFRELSDFFEALTDQYLVAFRSGRNQYAFSKSTAFTSGVGAKASNCLGFATFTVVYGFTFVTIIRAIIKLQKHSEQPVDLVLLTLVAITHATFRDLYLFRHPI